MGIERGPFSARIIDGSYLKTIMWRAGYIRIGVVVALLVAGSGCGKSKMTLGATQTKAFDSAQPGVKARWAAAVSALTTNDYAGSQIALYDLRDQLWITGYYPAQNGVEPLAEIPWALYTEVNHFAAAAGVGAGGRGNGTVRLHYLTSEGIRQFVAAGHAAGCRVLVTIKDNDQRPNAFAENTAPAMLGGFVSNIVQFVTVNQYDGVDVDWESGVIVSQYVDLLARLRASLGASNLITVAVGNWNNLEKVANQAQASINHVNIMCYDMDNTGSYAWHNAALRQNGDPTLMTCDWRVRAFTGAGVARRKLGIGMPFYGRRWTGATAPLQTGGSCVAGWVSYRDLVTDPLRWRPEHQRWDDQHGADYLSLPALNEFDSFNGEKSIQSICRWAREEGFGGFMTFELSSEYLPGQIGEARYPLSTALRQATTAVIHSAGASAPTKR
jgi:hypothetical protein